MTTANIWIGRAYEFMDGWVRYGKRHAFHMVDGYRTVSICGTMDITDRRDVDPEPDGSFPTCKTCMKKMVDVDTSSLLA